MSSKAKLAIILIGFLVVGSFILGLALGLATQEKVFRKEAIKRGFADWVMPPHPSYQKPVWRWRGEEQEDE